MVKSKNCHLHGKSCAELVSAKEESLEMGGYFICNGIERIIRLLILQVRSVRGAMGAVAGPGCKETQLCLCDMLEGLKEGAPP
jgi:hypothetical protein